MHDRLYFQIPLSGIFVILFLMGCVSTTPDQRETSETCSQRFSNFALKDSENGHEIRRIQNFILTEAFEDRLSCAKQIALETEETGFKDYFVALAHYFDFGDPASNMLVHESMRRFFVEGFSTQDGNCTARFARVLGGYNHIDCGAPGLLWAFVLLETDYAIFTEQNVDDPYQLDQLYHLWFTALFSKYSMLPAVQQRNIDKHGPPKSLTLASEHIDDYVQVFWGVSTLLSYQILKTAEATQGDDFVIYGNKVGSTRNDLTFWTDSKFNQFGQDMVMEFQVYIKENNPRYLDHKSDDYLGNTPASYCQIRLFIFSLLSEGIMNYSVVERSPIYEKCVQFKAEQI